MIRLDVRLALVVVLNVMLISLVLNASEAF